MIRVTAGHLGGVVHAYRTMERTGEPSTATARRFFYAHAQRWCAVMRPGHERERFETDPHAPPAYRANGPLSNMPEFSAAFSCAPGQRTANPPAAASGERISAGSSS